MPKPARYFPIEKGLYEVAPGLRPLGAKFGNNEADGWVFQLDSEWPRYRENILECRRERLNKYYRVHEFSPEVDRTVSSFIVARLAQEHPEFFKYSHDGIRKLECLLTQDKLYFDADWSFVKAESTVDPPYASGFDALASQVPEDLCVMQQSPDKSKNWLTAIHLCCAGHWAAEDKIGQDFVNIHVPVPGIQKINSTAPAFVDAMVRKGPFVRFAWGFSTDLRLNHHPQPPEGIDADAWRGRRFSSPEESKLYVRVERQTTWGFPEVNASLFTIRVYYIDGDQIRANERECSLLYSALESMTRESRVYKGLAGSIEPLLSWLRPS